MSVFGLWVLTVLGWGIFLHGAAIFVVSNVALLFSRRYGGGSAELKSFVYIELGLGTAILFVRDLLYFIRT